MEHKKEEIQKSEILSFLKKNYFAVLSTTREDGSPDAAAIYYLVDDDFCLYFPNKIGMQKYKNMKQEPRVAITINNIPDQITVKIMGVVEDVGKNSPNFKELINHMAIKFNELNDLEGGITKISTLPFLLHDEVGVTLMKVTPKEILYRDYNSKELIEGYITF